MILVALALAASAPSFDCSKASTNVERMICADDGLAAADRAVARLYAGRRRSDGLFFRKQSDWLADRNSCVDNNCLVASYEERLLDMFISTTGVKTRDYGMNGNPEGHLSIIDAGGGWSAFFAQAVWVGPDSMTAPQDTAHETQIAGVFKIGRGFRAPKDEFECGWKIQRLSRNSWKIEDWPGSENTPCGAANASVEGIYRP
jgi:hypothetical protein